ncbi:MAG: ABC transporter permease [Acidimicrobiales bacterium]
MTTNLQSTASTDIARPRLALIRALWLTWRAAWSEAWSNQRGFWTQVGLMFVNNLIFLVFWTVFFREVDSLRGWDVGRILVLLSVLTSVAGVVIGLLHNLRRIGDMAADGELDAALSLPVPTLLHLVLRRVEPVNVGDLVFGIILFSVFGSPTPTRVAVFVFGVLCGASVLAGFFVIIGSLGFFIGRGDSTDLGLQAIMLFSHYPIDIFPGLIRLFLYVVIPAGFVSALPATLIGDFQLAWAGLALLSAVGFLTLGSWVFRRGLARYTSGSAWTSG